MNNVDLIVALGTVRDLRAEIERLDDLCRETDDKEAYDSARHQLRDRRLKLINAEHDLADMMLTLQSGYDFALIPKVRVSS